MKNFLGSCVHGSSAACPSATFRGPLISDASQLLQLASGTMITPCSLILQRAAPHLARLQCTAAVGQLGDNKIALVTGATALGRRSFEEVHYMPHSSWRYLTTPPEVAASFTALFILVCSTLRNTLLKHVYCCNHK